jgi:hypothetical protein
MGPRQRQQHHQSTYRRLQLLVQLSVQLAVQLHSFSFWFFSFDGENMSKTTSGLRMEASR